MAQRVPITIKLDAFEGPLDLLLHLIQAHELDISRISIAKITDQYLAYVRLMQELNFDVAGEFLVLAATLLHWKSKALLPQDPSQAGAGVQDDDLLSPEDLVRQLLEHRRFHAAGQDLAQLPHLGEDVFTRPNPKPPVQRVWRELAITQLVLAYQDMLVRARRRTHVLRKETVSLTEKIRQIAQSLVLGKVTLLSDLLTFDSSRAPLRPEEVVTFLASLELSRLKKMRLHQNEAYQPIYVELIQSLQGFDPSLASGFDAVVARTEVSHAGELDALTASAEASDRAVFESAGLGGGPSPEPDEPAHLETGTVAGQDLHSDPLRS